jgi:hypothetical protein
MTDQPQDTKTPEVRYVRAADGRFLPGTRPPVVPTKGKLGGRALALRTLDSVMARERNQENLANALLGEGHGGILRAAARFPF